MLDISLFHFQSGWSYVSSSATVDFILLIHAVVVEPYGYMWTLHFLNGEKRCASSISYQNKNILSCPIKPEVMSSIWRVSVLTLHLRMLIALLFQLYVAHIHPVESDPQQSMYWSGVGCCRVSMCTVSIGQEMPDDIQLRSTKQRNIIHPRTKSTYQMAKTVTWRLQVCMLPEYLSSFWYWDVIY